MLRSLEADYLEVGGHQRGNASEPTEEAHDLSADQIPNGWEISTLRSCCRPGRPITYGILKPGPELEEGVSRDWLLREAERTRQAIGEVPDPDTVDDID